MKLITEIELPALDGSSKDLAYIVRRIAALPDVCMTPPTTPPNYTATDDLWK